jgi:beta-glucosidase
MCAYNSINGQPACANEFLLQDQLRGKWAFKGYVVSDCEAVRNIFSGHHYKPTQAEASAISLQRGMDNECIDFFTKLKDDHDYAPYAEAVKKGYLKESEIDTALIRLFTARMRLGLFDPPEMVPYNKIDEKMLNSSEHRALARKLANESMVLLKNDGILPLKTSDTKIAVFGPLADQTKVLLGNYNGNPTHTVSVLEGLKAEFPSAQIGYYEGTSFLSKSAVPAPEALVTIDGKPGVRTSYVVMDEASMLGSGPPPAPLATRIEPGIGIPGGPLPTEIQGKASVIINSEGTITAQETGDYNLGVRGDGFVRVMLDGKVVTMSFMANGVENKVGRVHFEKGKTYSVSVQYPVPHGDIPAPQLVWSKLNLKPSAEAIAAAKDADVLVAVVGITSELEGEEMPVSEEGFKGGDRTSLDLPKPEQELLEALSATGKPLVVVLMNGSALSVNWAKEHANAIVEAWYSGEEGGAAVAQTLSGKNNPGGRLPLTFYTGINQLPPFEDYSMKARTYRYFDGNPLYPFGYGLSYTSFSYSGLKLPAQPVKAGDPLHAQVTVTNTGKVAGDEVVQLYLKFPPLAGAPRIALRGFKRVHLEPGASQDLQFDLQPRDLGIVTEAGEPQVPEGEFTVSAGGGQPGAGAPFVTNTFQVRGSMTLPE